MARFDYSAHHVVVEPAHGGGADALYELGLMYCSGREDMPIDLVEAHKWFNLAAMRGNDDAKRYRLDGPYKLKFSWALESPEKRIPALDKLLRRLGAEDAAAVAA